MEELLKLFTNSNGSSPDIASLLPLFATLFKDNGAQKKDTAQTVSDPSLALYEMTTN